ncbi:MAG: sulfatase-like hydrolase/transferase [Candidatus Sumerlaeota bacterium]|nr:sulfatase-like hydrolase/transferase [Candidatus Sumerlaeota bacterium]
MSQAISRREFVKAGAAGAAGALAFSLGGYLGAAPAKAKPNVLIITTDQQRVDAMSAAGNTWAKTPAMDSIAANGVYFAKSYCPYPLCSPSRSALHTSRTPHELLVDHNSLPIEKSIPISGQVFGEAGYDTGYSGKWHIPAPYPSDGIAGYEVLNKTERKGKLAHDVDEGTMNQAIEFLKRKRDKPFLLVASFINPHDICLLAGETSPLEPDVWKRYEPKEGVQLPPLPANYALSENAAGPLNKAARHEDWDENHWRKYRHAYFRMVEDVDQQVGQILDALRKSGQEENTLVVFTSDHGEGLGCHHWTGKMNFFDDEAAVPLIISWKGVTPAARFDKAHLVSALDVLPTICDYAGVKPPAIMRGASLRGVIEKPQSPGHEYVASEMATGGAGAGAGRSFMIRTRKYKYVTYHAAQKMEMLFDMETDPGEMKNLTGETALASELDRHRKMLADWQQLTELEKYPLQANPETGRAAKKQAKKKNGAGK